MSNRNMLWAGVFVEELARAGLRHVCLAPGSRHTPLVLAFAEQAASFRLYSHLDERSAAFFALGLALATGEAAAVVCTSGTAATNFFPAIVEAQQSQVPLLVLTADRPPELRHSGANQTIDQVKLYGDYPLWAVDAALPEGDPAPLALRNLRTLAGRALATANGPRKGVVHINFPFRKPLEPTPVPGDLTIAPPAATAREGDAPFTAFTMPRVLPADADVRWLRDVIAAHPNGLIVCGPRCPGDPFPALVNELAARTGYPLLADPLSNTRFGHKAALGAYDTFLLNDAIPAAQPQVILRVGGVPTSNALNAFLAKTPARHMIQVSGSGVWADDLHRTSTFLHADASALCDALLAALPPADAARPPSPLADSLRAAEVATWAGLDMALADDTLTDLGIVADLLRLLPGDAALFVGNSLPVRLVDQVGPPRLAGFTVYGSRGASGIDGIISTALGVGAAQPGKRLVLLIGDVSFYHDMNGLLAVGRCGVPVTVVLLNNNGGGIFYRLPVRHHDPAFTDYFVTPHGLDFSHAARLYGLDYVAVEARAAFRQQFSAALASPASQIIEVRSDARQDFERRQAILDTILARG